MVIYGGSRQSGKMIDGSLKAMIIMTLFQKFLIGGILVAAAGASTYETHKVLKLRGQFQMFQSQQTPLIEQIRHEQSTYINTTNQLAALVTKNKQLQASQSPDALLKLRIEAAQLKAAAGQKENDPDESVANLWLNRVAGLKQYAEKHPDEKIPEFQFLTTREWLLLVDPNEPTDYGMAMQELKDQAQGKFAGLVQDALQKYSESNNGQFPADLSQLQSYCDSNVAEILQQRYEIKPVSILSANTIKDREIKSSQVIAGKHTISSLSANHIAIFAGGYTYYW
ncbi:MAG TPA: hypothetical protein VGO57_11800 [Verrucomicrobiae bacterium]|jgi:hypothetical protein